MGLTLPTLPALADYGIITGQDAINSANSGEQRQTLAQLGQLAAKGDYQGAAAAAFAGRQPDVGAKMLDLGWQQHQQMAQTAASLAYSADTPEKWAAAGQQWSKLYPGIAWDPDPSHRDAVVHAGSTLSDQIAQHYQQQELGIQQEDLGVRRLTAGMGALSNPYLTDEQRAQIATYLPGGASSSPGPSAAAGPAAPQAPQPQPQAPQQPPPQATSLAQLAANPQLGAAANWQSVPTGPNAMNLAQLGQAGSGFPSQPAQAAATPPAQAPQAAAAPQTMPGAAYNPNANFANTKPSALFAMQPDPNTPSRSLLGYSVNGVLSLANEYLATGKPPSVGYGSNPTAQATRSLVMNAAGEIADKLGMSPPEIQAAYAANKSAATQTIQRVARIDTTAQTLSTQFPRLAALAAKVGTLSKIQESDITAGRAAFLRKFGSPDAASYFDLLQTLRGDYAAMQSAIGGGKGGEGFQQRAQDAIPAGLAPQQYWNADPNHPGIGQTIAGSAVAANKASWDQARNRISNFTDLSGGAAGPVATGGGASAVYDWSPDQGLRPGQ